MQVTQKYPMPLPPAMEKSMFAKTGAFWDPTLNGGSGGEFTGTVLDPRYKRLVDFLHKLRIRPTWRS